MRRGITCRVIGVAVLVLVAASGTAVAEPGDIVWNVSLSEHKIDHAPTVVNGTVYVGGDGVHALDSETGEPRWSFAVDSGVSVPIHLSRGTVYAIDNAGVIHAVDASSGKVRWNASHPMEKESVGRWAYGRLAHDDDRLYVTANRYTINNTNTDVSALDASTGDLQWMKTVDDDLGSSAPVVLNDTVYGGTGEGEYYSMQAEGGKINWRMRLDGITSPPSPITVGNKSGYFGSRPGRIGAINTDNGTLRWSRDVQDQRVPVEVTLPTVWNNIVYAATSTGTLWAFDARNGQIRWNVSTGLGVLPRHAPTVADRTAYFVGQDGRIYALDAMSGKMKWRRSIDSSIQSGPIVADGLLFVSTLNGDVYAIDTASNASSADSRVLQGILGHHDSYAELGPTVPGDPRLDDVDYGSVEPADDGGDPGNATRSSESADGDQAVPGFGVIAAAIAVMLVASLRSRRPP